MYYAQACCKYADCNVKKNQQMIHAKNVMNNYPKCNITLTPCNYAYVV